MEVNIFDRWMNQLQESVDKLTKIINGDDDHPGVARLFGEEAGEAARIVLNCYLELLGRSITHYQKKNGHISDPDGLIAITVKPLGDFCDAVVYIDAGLRYGRLTREEARWKFEQAIPKEIINGGLSIYQIQVSPRTEILQYLTEDSQLTRLDIMRDEVIQKISNDTLTKLTEKAQIKIINRMRPSRLREVDDTTFWNLAPAAQSAVLSRTAMADLIPDLDKNPEIEFSFMP